MTAATATPLTRGRVQGREGRARPIAAQAAPNRGSAAGAGDTLSSLANSENDNGRDPDLSSKSSGGRPSAGLLAALGLRSLGNGSLEGWPAAGVEGVHLVPVAVFARAAGPPRCRVEGAQFSQALLFGRQGGLESLGKLGVVHRDDAEPRFQLQDLNFGPCQFEIDRFGHCHPLIYVSKLLNPITTPQVAKLCLYPHWAPITTVA